MVPRTEPVEYVPGDEELTTAVVTALSEAKNRDLTDEEPVLFDIVDLDALDRLFRGIGDDGPITVEFTTHDAAVEIRWNGRLTIEVQDLEADPTRH